MSTVSNLLSVYRLLLGRQEIWRWSLVGGTRPSHTLRFSPLLGVRQRTMIVARQRFLGTETQESPWKKQREQTSGGNIEKFLEGKEESSWRGNREVVNK